MQNMHVNLKICKKMHMLCKCIFCPSLMIAHSLPTTCQATRHVSLNDERLRTDREVNQLTGDDEKMSRTDDQLSGSPYNMHILLHILPFFLHIYVHISAYLFAYFARL